MPTFPINEYYENAVISSETLRKTHKTWVAALLIEEPRSKKHFLRIYEWKKDRHNKWKRHGVISIMKSSELRSVLQFFESMSGKLADQEAVAMSAKWKERKTAIIGKN